MKKILIMLMAIVMGGFAAVAQPHKMTEEQKERFFMAKMKMIQQELELTESQTNDFVPIYRSYNNNMSKLFDGHRKRERNMDRSTTDGAMNIVNERIDMKIQILRLQKNYYKKFKTVLTPKQMLRLEGAERKIQDQIMDRRGKGHRGKGPENR